MQHTPTTSCKDKTKIRGIYNRNLDLTSQLKAQKSKSHMKLSMQSIRDNPYHPCAVFKNRYTVICNALLQIME